MNLLPLYPTRVLLPHVCVSAVMWRKRAQDLTSAIFPSASELRPISSTSSSPRLLAAPGLAPSGSFDSRSSNQVARDSIAAAKSITSGEDTANHKTGWELRGSRSAPCGGIFAEAPSRSAGDATRSVYSCNVSGCGSKASKLS